MTDYYKVLGISKDATAVDVKVAFRKLALKFHPDKHVGSSDHSKKAAVQRFKELSEAYEVLSDDKKRSLYNRQDRPGFYSYRPGAHSRDTHRRTSDSNRGSYAHNPFHSAARPRARATFHPRWKFTFGFGRNDYLFHGLIVAVAVVGFAFADRAAEALWRNRNPGKSFEETMDAVERRKQEQIPEERKESRSQTEV